MHQLKFSSNANGKLFADVFGDIRLSDYEKFMINNSIEVWVGNDCWGIAEVVGYKDFMFKNIKDSIAIMNCGKGAAYQAILLKKFYGDLAPDASIMHIVFKWTIRYTEIQEPRLKDFWQNRMEQNTLTSFNQPK